MSHFCFADGMASGPHWGRVHFETGSSGAPKPTDGKHRLIRGEGLVTRISNDYEPQLPVVGEDIPGPAVTNYLGAVRSLEGCDPVDQRAVMVGHGFQLPCSDSDKSDDDVLSVGPMRLLVTATPLGGAGGHDDGMLQVNQLSEWSVNSWTAEVQFRMLPQWGGGGGVIVR